MALGIYKIYTKNALVGSIMTHKEETTTILIHVPLDVKRWIEKEAARMLASQNSEILRCIRARMDSAERAG
jgi:hypothetical protein